MSRYVFDIETNSLLPDLKRCWLIRAKDVDTKEKFRWLEGDFGWKSVFDNATLLVGHNIIGFDLIALNKLYGYKLPKTVTVHDTMVMSLVLDYEREQGHKLEGWGLKLGYHKIHFEDFSQYSPEMDVYCERDVDLNLRVYNELCKEFSAVYAKNAYIKDYLKAEHAVSKWCATAQQHGWPFDTETAIDLYITLEKEVVKTKAIIQPLLGMKTVAVDKKLGVVEPKYPKWIKNGGYSQHTANWFNIMWESGQDKDRLVEGPYSRVTFEPLDIDSIADMKIFLYRHNWQPTEWNYKFNEETRKREQTSPKITEDSLVGLEGNAKVYCEFLTNKSRRDILKGWLQNVDENDLLHGDCFTIGTPSMRSRHSIIVNVPSGELNKDGTSVSPWGPEMRKLFKCKPGWKLIGCDSSGNQARSLAHYLGDKDYIDLLLNGDIHQYNADILTAVLKSLGVDFKVPRPNAKRVLYAFLFGAAGDKILSYILPGSKISGNKIKAGFSKAVPGLEELLNRLEKIFGQTKKYGKGYIYGIAGNKIYCDSFHKLLVYLLQACEKATCSAAVMLTMERLEEENIPYIPLIFMHDEEDFMVPEKYSERAAEIGRKAFEDGPKLFGIEIMDGSFKIGDTWFDVH